MVAEKWAISATAEVFSPLIAFLRPPTPPHLLLLYLYFVVFHCMLLYFIEFLPLPRFFSPLLHSSSSPLAPLIFVFCCISLYFCNCPGFLSLFLRPPHLLPLYICICFSFYFIVFCCTPMYWLYLVVICCILLYLVVFCCI